MTKFEQAQGLTKEMNVAYWTGNTSRFQELSAQRNKIVATLPRGQRDSFWDWLEDNAE